MGSLEELLNHKKSVQENISKSFGSGFDLNEEWIQKARSGVYADTAENRKLNRVGQQYGSKKQEEGGADVSSQAAKASDGALKRAAADEKAPENVRNGAKEELKKRGKSVDEEKDLAEIPVNGRIRIEGVGYFKKVGKSDWVKFDPSTGKESDERINYTKISDNGYAKGVTIVDSSGKVVDSKNKNDDKKAEKNDSGKKKAEDNKKDETKLSKREISKLERQMNKFRYMRLEGSTVFGGNALPYDFSFGNISGNTLTIFR